MKTRNVRELIKLHGKQKTVLILLGQGLTLKDFGIM